MDALYISDIGFFSVLLSEVSFIQVARFNEEQCDTLTMIISGHFTRIYCTKDIKKMKKEYKNVVTAWRNYRRGRSLEETLDIAAKNIAEEMQGTEESDSEESEDESDNKNS